VHFTVTKAARLKVTIDDILNIVEATGSAEHILGELSDRP
jgi:hypothetical protein